MLLNDYGGFKFTEHTRATGKKRTTVEIHAEAIGIVVDDVAAGQHIAETLQHLVREGMRQTTRHVAAATLGFRERAKAALETGAKWARGRYAGGQLGKMEPDPTSVRFGNDSGRLRRSFVMRYAPAIASWVGNVAANRLTADQPALRARMAEWLKEIIDAALADEEIPKAVQKTLDNMVFKAGERGRDLETNIVRALQQALTSGKQLVDQVSELAEEPPPDEGRPAGG